jgi:hypothetical protein
VKGTNQPFPVALEAVELELLHGDNHPSPRLDRHESSLVHPSLEHGPKAALSKQVVWPEVPRGASQLAEGEFPDIRPFQNLCLGTRSRRHRRRGARCLGAKSAAVGSVLAAILGTCPWILQASSCLAKKLSAKKNTLL